METKVKPTKAMATFAETYKTNKTWGDGDASLDALSDSELARFISAHEYVYLLTGLDECQKYYLISAQILLKVRLAKKKESGN